MLMQALRKGFLRVKKKRDLAGRGLPPVAWSFFSFSLCFLFNSSSFMMTGFAASALVAILTPPPETISKGESTHRIIPTWGAEGPPPPFANHSTGIQARLSWVRSSATFSPFFASPTVTDLSQGLGACDRKSPLSRGNYSRGAGGAVGPTLV